MYKKPKILNLKFSTIDLVGIAKLGVDLLSEFNSKFRIVCLTAVCIKVSKYCISSGSIF